MIGPETHKEYYEKTITLQYANFNMYTYMRRPIEYILP